MPRTFGVEVETVGVPPEKVADAVRSITGGTSRREIDPDDPDVGSWLVETRDGRTWRVEDDDSLQSPLGERAELVSPVLTERDLDLLVRIVDAVRHAGATVNAHCGVHVHVGAATCGVEHLNNAIDLLIVLEPLVIERMLGINEHRRKFTGLMAKEFVDRFRASRPTTFEELWAMWGGPGYDARRRGDRYDVARYKGFNLHSHAFRGTIEFRYFNGTVDSQRIVEYVRLCLGIAERAGFPVPSTEDA